MLICFEDPVQQAIFTALYPERSAEIRGIEALLSPGGPLTTLSRSERTQLIETWLPVELKPLAERALDTLEQLRQTLILTHEDVDYCFSRITQSPKNIWLKDLFHRYLDSLLVRDKTYQHWNAIEKIKQGDLNGAPHQGLCFVRSMSQGALFLEVAKTFSLGSGTTRLCDFWDCIETRNAERASFCYQSTTPTAILALTSHVRTLLRRGIPAKRICIPLAAQPHTQAFLQYALDHEKIPWRIFPDRPTLSESALSTLLGSLRRCVTLPLNRRLEISRLLLRRNSQTNDTDDLTHVISELSVQRKLDESEFSLLQSLIDKGNIGPAEEHASDGVILAPFFNVPSSRDVMILAFADSSILKPKMSPTLMDLQELEQLKAEGFPVWTYPMQQKAQWESLVRFGKRSHANILFTSLYELPFTSRIRSSKSKFKARPEINDENTHVDMDLCSLSATQLETYARCPSAYLFANRMQLKPIRGGWDSDLALVLGQTVHRILELYFRRFSQLTEISKERLNEFFIEAFSELFPSWRLDSAFFRVLQVDFENKIPMIVEIERQLKTLLPGSKPVDFEHSFEFKLGDFSIRGKIDRIQESAQGILLLDYKTGRVDFSPSHIGFGDFQALIYLLAVRATLPSTNIGILFYDLKRGELKRGLVLSDFLSRESIKSITRGHALDPERFEEVIARGISQFHEMAEGIKQGNFVALPNETSCRNCEMGLLCRRKLGYA